ncbi:MAG: polyamine aminopropyltransferase [Gammaproteobacteria bacterium]|nr:polyamine aminopropyltransferase [Gammaproteobacteria bacterium]
MAILAGCGLIYEYLLSHYAGRILGTVATSIFIMIGIMIVAMGIGAFLARIFKDCFTAFAWLEVAIALLGATAVLMIAVIFSLTHLMPQIIADVYGLPPDLAPTGGIIQGMIAFTKITPYLFGFILGLMIGMEIPLIAKVREKLYGEHLENNTGSIYGIDYIGAGVGAALWVTFMLAIDPYRAAIITASANIVAGLLFLALYRKRIRFSRLLLALHGIVVVVIIIIANHGSNWDKAMEDMLYQDKVIYRMNTKYQHITITERTMDPAKPPVLTLYINGRTQFASNDEHIYHSMLTYPAMAASARHEKILIVGGGDGLALRNVLQWNPEKVTLLDLDEQVIQFFSTPLEENGRFINEPLLKLNDYSFSDPRVEIRIGDAYLKVDELLSENRFFDTIIVDLPDPSHPDLNNLYSARFYAKLGNLLSGDGAISIQSTSPYHAKNAFLSIGKTVKHAGFRNVDQYHQNVPSFGEWGWTIATKNGISARQRLKNMESLPINDGWITKGIILASFEFGRHYFDGLDQIKINRSGSNTAYLYHHQAWEQEQGIYEH